MTETYASPPAQDPIIVKCLLVDDRPENLLALSQLLKSDDVEIFEARSGAEALDLLLAHDFALALIDVQMPGMDGFEVAELMRGRERTRHVPIIFVTAGAQDQHRVFKGYDSGAVDFLFKPIEPRILANKAAVFFQLYRQRVQLARQLEERTRTLKLNEMFTAVLGHDLRNPLNAIATGAQLLEIRAADDATRTIAARMSSSSKRMGRLIDDLLDLTRARLAGGIPLRRSTVDLKTTMDRVVQELSAAAQGRRVDAVFTGDLEGAWDGDRLAQIASNLLGNAVKHGEEHGAITIALDGTNAEHVTMKVSNHGSIPEHIVPNLFDPFQGGDRVGTEGLGLGLYIVHQIVKSHEGFIGVHSKDGKTEFIVTLPRTQVDVVRL